MENQWIISINKYRKKNEGLFNQVILETYKKNLSWKEIKDLKKHEHVLLAAILTRKYKIADSPLDVKKLSRAIQLGQSGIGYFAMTTYKCKLCDNEEIWNTTTVPAFCKTCSDNFAEKIILYGFDLLKSDFHIKKKLKSKGEE